MGYGCKASRHSPCQHVLSNGDVEAVLDCLCLHLPVHDHLEDVQNASCLSST